MSTHFRALISAPTKDEACKILDTLLEKRIVAGGLISHGPSRYWWDGKIEEREYYNISTFIPARNKAILIEEVKAISSDETPIIALLPMDGSQDFLDWVDNSAIDKFF
jgi:uncharacterized protein involved in tolerance to divalent cations